MSYFFAKSMACSGVLRGSLAKNKGRLAKYMPFMPCIRSALKWRTRDRDEKLSCTSLTGLSGLEKSQKGFCKLGEIG